MNTLKRQFTVITIALVLVVVTASVARAQEGIAGAQPNRAYSSQMPFERMDPLSGNLMLQFTDLVLPGNAGRDLRFQRTFNLKGGFAQGGGVVWAFGLAGMTMSVKDDCAASPGHPYCSTPGYLPLPLLVGADGSLTSTILLNQPAEANDVPGYRWVTTDQFATYDRAAHRLYLPDGSISDFLWINSWGAYLTSSQDAFGNQVSLTGWGTSTLTVTQQLGNGEQRVVDLQSVGGYVWGGGGVFENPSLMTYAGRTWQYGSLYSTVTPPEGTSWQNTLQFGWPASTLTVTTPNGGTTQYTFEWRDFQTGELDENDNPIWWSTMVTTGKTVGGRDVAPGTWTYAYQLEEFTGAGAYQGLSHQTVVTGPTGTTTKYVYCFLAVCPNYTGNPNGAGAGGNYTGRWAFLTTRTVESPAGTVLESESRTYQDVPIFGSYFCWCTPATAQVPELASRTITRNGRSYTTQFAYSSSNYGDYHHPNQITETGDLARTTTRAFEHHEPPVFPAYIVGLLTGETVQVGSESFTKSFVYNTYGFMTAETIYGLTTTFTPDVCVGITSGSCGNVATMVRNGQGGQKTTTYQYSYGVVKQVTLPNGDKVVRIIDPAGLVTEETRSGPAGQNARTTMFTYDNLFRLTSTQPPGGVAPITTEYEVNGWWVTVRRGGPIPAGSQVTTTLDGFGRPRCTSNSQNVLACTEYDAEGRKSRESLPVVSCGFGCGPTAWTTFAYDGLGRLTTKTNPGGSLATYAYEATTDALMKITDENNHVTEQALQGFGDPGDGRLARVKDALMNTWTYSYNALGNLTRVHPPTGSDRTWTYDTSNRLKDEFQPESGMVTYTYVSGTTLLTTKTDAKGTVFTHTYDHNSRLLTITADPLVGSNRVTTLTYEVGSDNRATMSVTGGAVTTFSYETATGRLIQRRDVVNSTTFDQFFAYDTLDQLITLTYPAGRKVGYEYNSEGQITRVCSKNAQGNCTAGADYASGFVYHPSGAVSQYTGRYGLIHQFGYDDRYRVQTIATCTTAACTSPGNRLVLGYTYDVAGNVLTITDTSNGRDPTWNQTFEYDALDRLINASGKYGTPCYLYDARGNRLNCGGTTYTYNGNDRLTQQSTVNFTYDVNGNLLTQSLPSLTLTYTPDNRIATATGSVSYYYDADGWRVRTTIGSTTTYAVRGPAGALLSDKKGSLTRDYVYAGDRLIAWAESTGTMYDVTTDAIGSVRMVTTSTQAIKERHDFWPFGEEWAPPASPVSVMKFAGKERDTETGLDYFGARYYRGNSGRFMGVDPIQGFPKLPQSWNRYAYALNNPFRYIDPDGMLWIESGKAEDPYSWVDACGQGQQCYIDVAAEVKGQLWIYGRNRDIQKHDSWIKGLWQGSGPIDALLAEEAVWRAKLPDSSGSGSAGAAPPKMSGSCDSMCQMASDINRRAGPMTNVSTYGKLAAVSVAGGLALAYGPAALAAAGDTSLSVMVRMETNVSGSVVEVFRLYLALKGSGPITTTSAWGSSLAATYRLANRLANDK